MVFELVKNSLRAVQERFVDSDKVAPPIRIIVADGIEDVTIKVLGLHSFYCSVVNNFYFYLFFFWDFRFLLRDFYMLLSRCFVKAVGLNGIVGFG